MKTKFKKLFLFLLLPSFLFTLFFESCAYYYGCPSTAWFYNSIAHSYDTTDCVIAVCDSGVIVKDMRYCNTTFQSSGTNQNLNEIIVNGLPRLYVAGNTGVILVTTNYGQNWISQNSNTTNNLNSITFGNKMSIHVENIGYAAGDFGTVVKTINAGANWQVLNTGITENLNTVLSFGDTESDVMVFGDNLTAYRSTNGGNNWSPMTFPTEYTEGRSPKLEEAFFLDTVFSNALTGYIVGDSWVWKTTNGGNNWGSSGSFGTTQLHTIYFSSPDSGFVAGEDGEVYYTTNGGEDWDLDTAASNITTKTIRSFSVLDTNLAVVVGDNGLLVYVSTDSITSGIGNNNAGSAMSFLLSQNYPNPFNPNTNISFKIPTKSFVKLSVYDINGRQISNLVNETKVRGEYIVGFRANNLPSGVYFYRIVVEEINSSDKFTETKKMLLIK